jgi:CRP-like cAMP-binding protein
MNFNSSAFVADPDLLAALRRHETPVDCRDETLLFRQGDKSAGLYILHAGEATMSLENADGDSVVKAPMFPGALLGVPALVGDEPYSMTAIAAAGARVGFVNRYAFSALMFAEPLLAVLILRLLAAELRSLRRAVAATEAPILTVQ